MPGYRFRLGSFSSHSSRGSTQESQGASKSNVKYEIKLAVLGKTGVGKTAIIHRFLYDQFPEKHTETIDEVYLNELELVKGVDTRLTLDILDCGGSDEFPAMKRIGILNSNAFILVYSVDDSESFEEVRRLRELIWEIKLEKHIAKYSNTSIKEQQISIKSDTFVGKETSSPNSIISSINPLRQPVDLKVGQRRYSLQTPLNGTYVNGRINEKLTNQLTGQLGIQMNATFANQMNSQFNNHFNNRQQEQNNQTKRHRHHHHDHGHKKAHKKPYIVTNINQRYKLSENLKLISERRKSLTNATRIGELKSKLDNILETNLNDVTHQPTADILCLHMRPSKLQTTSLPVYGMNGMLFDKQRKEQIQLSDKTNDDILDDESNHIQNNTNRGRRRSSFLLSPDSLSSESSSCSSDSECESSNCVEASCSSSSSCCSLNNLNTKLDHHKHDKENKNNNFEHINNLNNYKSKLESQKKYEEMLLNENIPPFEPPVIVVVGNKCDLEGNRAVLRDLAENIVQIDWDNGFIECSAKNNMNMTAVFKEMLKQSKLPFLVSNALDSQKNRRRSLPAYPSNGLHLKEPNFRTKRNSCALS